MSPAAGKLPPTVFIGAGRMASAIVRGLLGRGASEPGSLSCTCGDDPSGPALAAATGIRFDRDVSALLPGAELVLLACKPQQLSVLPAELGTGASEKVVVSILAGIPLERLRTVFPSARAVVRVMPNTPARIGMGVSAFAADRPLDTADRAAVETLLGAMGDHVEVSEEHLDAVTALSGSGPAYLFEFVRLLEKSGTRLGLPADTAALLARKTVVGAAALLESRSDASPADLVGEVTSPGGTTEAALRVLEGRFGDLLSEALLAARERSRELSRS